MFIICLSFIALFFRDSAHQSTVGLYGSQSYSLTGKFSSVAPGQIFKRQPKITGIKCMYYKDLKNYIGDSGDITHMKGQTCS